MNLLVYLNTKLCACSYGWEYLNNQFNALLNHTEERRRKLLNITFDVFLGILLCVTLQTFTSTKNITVLILELRTYVKHYLENVLKWLMGVPAGLKLNHELSNFLGQFFLYHVYIWMSYLYFIERYLNTLVVMVTYSSCFGVTFFLSLLNDLINLMTFHIYCFYVYAARLYYLQLKGLVSLARLFMGKKWNVLRLRVDSISYNAEELIIGTISFTILLFLLPTTLIFYVVFTLTRLVVLIVQEIIRCIVVTITGFQIANLFTGFMNQGFAIYVYLVPVVAAVFQSLIYKRDNLTFWFESMDTKKQKKPSARVDELTRSNGLRFPDFHRMLKDIATGVLIRPWSKNLEKD